jgi:hypothetical protein
VAKVPGSRRHSCGEQARKQLIRAGIRAKKMARFMVGLFA